MSVILQKTYVRYGVEINWKQILQLSNNAEETGNSAANEAEEAGNGAKDWRWGQRSALDQGGSGFGNLAKRQPTCSKKAADLCRA